MHGALWCLMFLALISIAFGLWLLSTKCAYVFVEPAATKRRSRLARAAQGAWPVPAKVVSLQGQKARQLLLENPALFQDSLETELAALSDESEVDKERPEVTEDLNVLRQRIEEVRRSERGCALSELLYLMVCDRFRAAGYAMAMPLQAGGRADLGEGSAQSILELHSAEMLEGIEDHLAQSMPGGMAAASSAVLTQLVQLPFFNIGQAYALTLQYGYVLKRAESRLQLERSLQPEKLRGSRSLQSYVSSIGPGMFQDAMVSVEAHIASKMQVEALFGDLQVLRGHLASALAKRKSRSTGEALQDAVNCGEVAAVYLYVSDVRRLLLEAASFGTQLWDSEVQALRSATLTPANRSRLDDFGVDTDGDGNPILG